MSEKQGLGQVLWNGGTIDGDEGSGCSGATHMDGAGDEFLAYTTFTRNHDTDGIAGLDFFDVPNHLRQTFAGSDETIHGPTIGDLLTHRGEFLICDGKGFFGRLTSRFGLLSPLDFLLQFLSKPIKLHMSIGTGDTLLG